MTGRENEEYIEKLIERKKVLDERIKKGVLTQGAGRGQPYSPSTLSEMKWTVKGYEEEIDKKKLELSAANNMKVLAQNNPMDRVKREQQYEVYKIRLAEIFAMKDTATIRIAMDMIDQYLLVPNVKWIEAQPPRPSEKRSGNVFSLDAYRQRGSK